MADFEALIKAKLDTTSIPGQIKSEIESKEITLTPNTNKLITDIQSALKSGNFTVDVKLGNINQSSIHTQAQKTGTTVGKTIANAARSQLDNLKLDFDGTTISNLEKNLKSLGFSDESIAKVTQGLNEMSLTIDKITTKVSGGDLSITVKGTNEVGDAVTVLEKYSAETDDVVTKSETLSRSFKETGNQISNLQVIKLENKMKTWLEKNSAATKDYGESVQALCKNLEGIDVSSPNAAAKLKEIDTNFQEIQQSAIAAGKAGKSFGDRLKSAFSGVFGVVSVASVLRETVNVLKDMYKEVYEIDTAMIELRKVTEETAASYDKFLSVSGDVAKRIGTSITDYVNSTADFARLGYNFKSSQELAQVANIYNVVGDDINGIEDATQSIISTMTAFNVSAEDSINIVDKFNEVSNNYAISSGGIGTALQKSASAMAAANNSLDQTIALITAANTVAQDPDSVGTAFKTLSMRIRGAKTDLEEAGLDADGMASSVSKLREEIMALSGVDIMIDDDNFKSTYDILKDLSEVWDQLTDVSQANVLELIAGKRQSNIVSALLNNFEIADKSLATSLNSSGSALEEHSKYMESLEAKTKQFQAEWQELSMTVLNSDFLKGLVDAGTGLLGTLTKIIDTIGVLNTVAIGGGLTAFIRNFD